MLLNMAQNSSPIAMLISAARTATTTSSTRLNRYNRGAQVVIDVTAVTSTPIVTVDVQGKDSLSGKWYSLSKSQPLTETGTTVLNLTPDSVPMPRVFRVVATHADTDSITYSVAANLLV